MTMQKSELLNFPQLHLSRHRYLPKMHRVNKIAHTDLNSFLNTFTDGTFRRNGNANRGSFSRHKPSYGMY